MAEKLLTIREVSQFLDIDEREVIKLAEEGKLPAYRIAEKYLRFKRSDIEKFSKGRPGITRVNPGNDYSFQERLVDFFYFSDFYLLCLGIIVSLLWFILKFR